MKPPPLDAQAVADIPTDKIAATIAVRAAEIAALTARLLTEVPVVVVNDHGNGTAPDETLDVPAIAQSIKKSRRWVWRNQKKLPLRRIGRGLICSRRELDRWLAGQRVK